MIHTHITHIIKNNFFLAFKQVFYVIMNSKNIQINFKIIEFIPYNFCQIFNYLDFNFHIFISLNILQQNSDFMNPNIFYTIKNVLQNFANLKSKITKHYNNFFIHLYELINA